MKIDTDTNRCPKCKENFITIMGGSIERLCRCNNSKKYDMIKESFKLAFNDEDDEE